MRSTVDLPGLSGKADICANVIVAEQNRSPRPQTNFGASASDVFCFNVFCKLLSTFSLRERGLPELGEDIRTLRKYCNTRPFRQPFGERLDSSARRRKHAIPKPSGHLR